MRYHTISRYRKKLVSEFHANNIVGLLFIWYIAQHYVHVYIHTSVYVYINTSVHVYIHTSVHILCTYTSKHGHEYYSLGTPSKMTT